MRQVEHEHQKAFFEWCEYQKNKYPELALFHAIPNGGARHVSVAKKLKSEGVKAGVLDTQLPVPRGGFIGLAIEFKAPFENPTKEQKERAEALLSEGWCVFFCWSWASAKRATLGYLGMLKVQGIDA